MLEKLSTCFTIASTCGSMCRNRCQTKSFDSMPYVADGTLSRINMLDFGLTILIIACPHASFDLMTGASERARESADLICVVIYPE